MAKGLSAAKAKKILTDGYVKGKPLTAKQKKYFGAIASGATPLKAINGGWLDKYQDEGSVPKAQYGLPFGVKSQPFSDVYVPNIQWAENVQGLEWAKDKQQGMNVSGVNLSKDFNLGKNTSLSVSNPAFVHAKPMVDGTQFGEANKFFPLDPKVTLRYTFNEGGSLPKAQGGIIKLAKNLLETPTLALPPRKGYGNANLDQVINTTANTLRNKGVGTDAYDVANAIGHDVANSGIPENVYRGVKMPLTEEGMSKLSNRRVMDYSQVGGQHLMTNNEGMLKMQEYAVSPDLARFQGISGNNIGNSNYMINAPWTSTKEGALPYAITSKKIVNNSDGSMSISNKEYQDEIGNLPQGMLQEFVVNKNKSLFGVNSGAIGSLSDLMSKKLGKPINQITLKESEEFARKWGIDYFKDKGFRNVPEYQFMPGKMKATNSKFIYKNGGGVPKAQVGSRELNQKYIDSTLNANKDIRWVQRLYEKNPEFYLEGQTDPSTHFMESGDGYVYPRVMEGDNGQLEEVSREQGRSNGIKFPNDEVAQWFAKNYKKGTNVLKEYQMGGSVPKAQTGINQSIVQDDSADSTSVPLVPEVTTNVPDFQKFLFNTKDTDGVNKVKVKNLQTQFDQFNSAAGGSCVAGALNCNTGYITPSLSDLVPVRTMIENAVKVNPKLLEKYKIKNKPSGKGNFVKNNSIDAWEIHQLLRGEGLGTAFFTANDNTEWNGQLPKDLDLTTIPLGAIIGQGNAQGTYTKSEDNEEGQPKRNRHGLTVVGHDFDGMPMVYDSGSLERLDNLDSLSHPSHKVTNITVPKGYEKYTYNYMNEQNNKKIKDLGYEQSSTLIKGDVSLNSDWEPIKQIEEASNYYAPTIAIDYGIPKDTMEMFVKLLPGLSAKETKLNNKDGFSPEVAVSDNAVVNMLKFVPKIAGSVWDANVAPFKAINNLLQGNTNLKSKSLTQTEIDAYKEFNGDMSKVNELVNRQIAINESLPKINSIDNIDQTFNSSVGAFRIKDFPEYATERFGINKSDLFGTSVTSEQEFKKGTAATLTFLAEKYQEAKKLYKDKNLTEEQLVDLSIVGFNKQSDFNNPEFVDFYIKDKKLENNYLKRVKEYNYNEKRIIDGVEYSDWESFREAKNEKKKSVNQQNEIAQLQSVPKGKNGTSLTGGWLDKYQTGGTLNREDFDISEDQIRKMMLRDGNGFNINNKMEKLPDGYISLNGDIIKLGKINILKPGKNYSINSSSDFLQYTVEGNDDIFEWPLDWFPRKKKKPEPIINTLQPEEISMPDAGSYNLTGDQELLKKGRDIKTIPYNLSNTVLFKDKGNQYTMDNGELKRKQTREDYRKNNLRPNGKEYQMGGSLPGASGMMYGRTSGNAPMEPGKLKKAQNGISSNFGGVDTNVPDLYGNPIYDVVNNNDPNYDAKYRETYEGGAFAFKPNPLDEVVIDSRVDYNKDIYYDTLTDQEKDIYHNDQSPIGNAVRRKAQTKKGLAEDTHDVVDPLMYGMVGLAGGIALAPTIGGAARLAAPYVSRALNYKPLAKTIGNPFSIGNTIDAGSAAYAAYATPDAYDEFKENPNWDTGIDLALTASDLLPLGEIATGFKGTRRLINSAANKFNDLTSLKPNFTPIERVVENEAGRLKNLFNQPNIYPTSSPLPERMEPYLSRKVYPFNKEQEVFESFLSTDRQLKNIDSKSINYDAAGNIIPNFKQGGVIKDDMGQWAHPGEVTEISGNTMATHGYGDNPLYVVPDVGEPRMVQANTGTQTFPGATKFTEYPMAKNGSLVELNQLTNFTNYNTPQPGGWLDKYN